jgi:hypothetical protein
MGDRMMAIRGYDLLVETLREYVEGWKPCVVLGYIERRRLVAKTIRREEVERPRWTSRGEGVGSRRKRSGNRCAVSGLSDETSEADYDDNLGTEVGSLARSGQAMDSQIASASHEENFNVITGTQNSSSSPFVSEDSTSFENETLIDTGTSEPDPITLSHEVTPHITCSSPGNISSIVGSPTFPTLAKPTISEIQIPVTNLTERETSPTSLEPRLPHDSPPAAIGTFLRSHSTNHIKSFPSP